MHKDLGSDRYFLKKEGEMMNKQVLEFKAASGEDSTGPGATHDDRGSGTSEQRRRELADFLRTRREKLKPEQVGIVQGPRRRTPGLRREEVAELAGVGTTWYTWLEQARDIQPSAEVLRRLGTALQLNPAEFRHMFALAGKTMPVDIEPTEETVSESMRLLIDESIRVPSVLVGARWDVLALNAKGEEMFPGIKELPENRRNWLYYVFCRQLTRERLTGWEANARRLLAEFRASLSESLDNPWVLEIVEVLKTESPEFANWWREHDVRDNSPVKVQLTIDGKAQLFERAVVKPWENTRYKIILFTPIP